jgi:hypothetical protein
VPSSVPRVVLRVLQEGLRDARWYAGRRRSAVTDRSLRALYVVTLNVRATLFSLVAAEPHLLIGATRRRR